MGTQCSFNLQKTWLVTLFGSLAAILNFTQKCKQTAVSQKLSKIKNFFSRYFFHLMRYLNYWDNKNFWGAKSGPLTHASSVNTIWNKWAGQISNFFYYVADVAIQESIHSIFWFKSLKLFNLYLFNPVNWGIKMIYVLEFNNKSK